MPQSISNVLLHLIFSTAGRETFLRDASLRDELHRYLGGIVNNLQGQSIIVGGVSDHVHLLCVQPKTISVSDLVRELKRSSSVWTKGRSPLLKSFSWQMGYGAFSVGQGEADAVRHYIANQEEHHRTRTFQEEYREFLTKRGVPFDERYVWE